MMGERVEEGGCPEDVVGSGGGESEVGIVEPIYLAMGGRVGWCWGVYQPHRYPLLLRLHLP